MIIFLIYLITINLYTFILMGVDKKRAVQGNYRISEANLLIPSFFFGAFGLMLAMSVFKHKTRKINFIILSRVFILIQLFIMTYALIRLQEVL